MTGRTDERDNGTAGRQPKNMPFSPTLSGGEHLKIPTIHDISYGNALIKWHIKNIYDKLNYFLTHSNNFHQ